MATKKEVSTQINQEDPAAATPELSQQELLNQIASLKAEVEALKVEPMGLKMISVELQRKFDMGNYNSLGTKVTLWYDLAPGEDPAAAFEYLWSTCRTEIRNVAEPILQKKGGAGNSKPPATTSASRTFMGAPVEGDEGAR